MAEDAAETCEEYYFRKIAPRRASAGDYREFFKLLWLQHGQIILKYAYSRLGKYEDARDICQDAFVRAMVFIQSNPGRILPRVNFRAWLRVIVRNLICDRFRRVQVRPDEIPREVGSAPEDHPPEESLITAEDLAILRKCLESLTERARTIVVLADMEGIGHRNIAEKLESNPNAVNVALHRARKTLRECVGTMSSLSSR